MVQQGLFEGVKVLLFLVYFSQFLALTVKICPCRKSPHLSNYLDVEPAIMAGELVIRGDVRWLPWWQHRDGWYAVVKATGGASAMENAAFVFQGPDVIRSVLWVPWAETGPTADLSTRLYSFDVLCHVGCTTRTTRARGEREPREGRAAPLRSLRAENESQANRYQMKTETSTSQFIQGRSRLSSD